MIKLEFNGSEATRKLDAMPGRVHDEVKTAITGLALKLRNAVVSTKLSGQVLNRKTGALAGSIGDAVRDDGNLVAGVVSIAGDAMSKGHKVIDYGRAWEYGFSGDVTVREHMRMMKQAFGRDVEPREIMVGSFTRKVNMPERSFLRSALKDMVEAGTITVAIDAALGRAAQ